VTGQPILRPLVYQHRNDPRSVACDDQFYIGDWLLMAPGYRQGEESRTVYLPEGNWINLWTEEPHHGPADIDVSTPILSLQGVAVFVRQGAILPRQPVTQCLDNDQPVELTFDIYPGNRSRFCLHEAVGQVSELAAVREDGRLLVSLQNMAPVDRRYTACIHGVDAARDVAISGGEEDRSRRRYDPDRRTFTLVTTVPAGSRLDVALAEGKEPHGSACSTGTVRPA
ncbi:MAG: hypothetical protein ACK2U9_21270, partial [Anaerolineae bacterium]